MQLELSVALHFLVSYLYNKLPRRRVDVFVEELEKGLKNKFKEHWYPDEPFKGSGYRSIRIVEGKIDPVFRVASQLSGLGLEEILDQLPKGLTIWIDPDEVSYRIGETGQVTILYYNKRSTIPVDVVGPSSGLDNTEPFESFSSENLNNAEQLNQLYNCFGSRSEHPSLSSAGNQSYSQDFTLSFEKLQLDANAPLPYVNSPSAKISSTNVNSLIGLPRSNNSNCFTAAAFAQTKFGSTKMRTHTNHHNRPSRLAATAAELQNRLNLAAQINAFGARSPGSFLPFSGVTSQLKSGSWQNDAQLSAPSSCLSSPSNGFMPVSSNHLFSHLIQTPARGENFEENCVLNLKPSQYPVFDCINNSCPSGSNVILPSSARNPSNEIPSPDSSLSTHSITSKLSTNPLAFNIHLTSQVDLKSYPFLSSSKKLNPGLKMPSTPDDSNTPHMSSGVFDWTGYLSSHPNIQHLLVAN